MECKDTDSICFYCLKYVVHKNELQCTKKNRTLNSRNFRQYALQSSHTDPSDTHKWLDSNGTLLKEINMVCEDCQYILQTHQKFRLKLETLQQKLKMELETLHDIMKMATKLPSRVAQSKMSLEDKEDYKTFCSMRQTVIDECFSNIKPKKKNLKVSFQLNNHLVFESKLADNIVPKMDSFIGKEVNMEIKVDPFSETKKYKNEKYFKTEKSIDFTPNASLNNEDKVQPKKENQVKKNVVQQSVRKLRKIFRCGTCHRTFASSDSFRNHKEGISCTDWQSILRAEEADQFFEVREQNRFPETASHDKSDKQRIEMKVTEGEITASTVSSLSTSGAMEELPTLDTNFTFDLPTHSRLPVPPPSRRFDINVNDQRTTVVQCNFCHIAFLNEHFLREHVKAKHKLEVEDWGQ